MAKKPAPGSNIATILKSVVDRTEKLMEDKSGLTQDIADIMREAKGNGLSPAIIRKVIRLRAMDAQKRAEEDYVTDVYRKVVGIGEDLT